MVVQGLFYQGNGPYIFRAQHGVEKDSSKGQQVQFDHRSEERGPWNDEYLMNNPCTIEDGSTHRE